MRPRGEFPASVGAEASELKLSRKERKIQQKRDEFELLPDEERKRQIDIDEHGKALIVDEEVSRDEDINRLRLVKKLQEGRGDKKNVDQTTEKIQGRIDREADKVEKAFKAVVKDFEKALRTIRHGQTKTIRVDSNPVQKLFLDHIQALYKRSGIALSLKIC